VARGSSDIEEGETVILEKESSTGSGR